MIAKREGVAITGSVLAGHLVRNCYPNPRDIHVKMKISVPALGSSGDWP